ncbi:putative glutamine amidotransferase [Marinitoga piezophila KA3]|uniref:Putative glutamine amidotransferase n=2 Tax=Petrotogaceae TaxID=1643949 RepID=H2J6Q8_MARPK|nr:putative glutamine amidotransferase [Marinitoga piezophila KA3]APT76737.1 hypothetical protein LN42_10390 [Marinitoga sp. 1137]NUU98432.1 hypothetical protein [Marinitoga sp. 1138]
MCRMIGYSFKKNENINFLFNHLKTMAKDGIKAPHDDGWGIAAFVSDKEVVFHKSMQPVFNEDDLNIESYLGMIHARKASDNLEKTFLQLHPYFIKDTFFSHNGTIYLDKIDNVFGTDSFEYFKALYDFNNFNDLKEKIKEFISKNSYSGINFLMIRNNELYVFCNYTRTEDYFTLWYTENDTGFIVASEKMDNSFIPFENGMLAKIVNGKMENILYI